MLKDKYSIWIVPGGEAGNILTNLVKEIALENKAPIFIPHITLVANILADINELEDLIKKIEDLSKQLECFNARLNKYDYKDEMFRCLYLLVNSPDIDNLYKRSSKFFPQIQDEHFKDMPHLSVLYGDYEQVVKDKIIASHPLPTLSFKVNELQLFMTDEPIEKWKYIKSFMIYS